MVNNDIFSKNYKKGGDSILLEIVDHSGKVKYILKDTENSNKPIEIDDIILLHEKVIQEEKNNEESK